jgi:hypothetical protein
MGVFSQCGMETTHNPIHAFQREFFTLCSINHRHFILKLLLGREEQRAYLCEATLTLSDIA